jgi:hypothetical protein
MSVRWQERKLRKALDTGNLLDALTAAARIHAIAVRPSLDEGRWPEAQAGCERVLGHIPARRAAGYLPGLRGTLESLHADAARAARECGDLDGAKSHMDALIGYLRERRAPLARQVSALIELAYLHIASSDPEDAKVGGRMLASVGPLLESAADVTPSDLDARRAGHGFRADWWGLRLHESVPVQRKATG